MGQARIYVMADPVELAARVRAAGGPAVDPTQGAGEASANGVTLSWKTLQGQILITIVAKPWMVSYSFIWSHVDEVLGASYRLA